MNLEHLKLFVRIAAIQNISLAGKELGLSPAVSSSHINKIEEDLGVRLIHRTTRRVSLTEEGKTFLPHAMEVLEKVESARASIGVGSVSPQGKLRVAAPASFGRMHLLPAIDDFLQRYQDLRIDLHLSDCIIDMVEGGFDIAIRDAELNDSTLIVRKLAPVTRIICASPSYLAKHGEPHSPQDLENHQCVNLIGLENWIFNTPDGKVNIKTNNVFRTDNGEAARDASVKGLGLTLSSTWCCYQQVQSGELIQVLKDYPLISNTAIWAVYPSSRLLAPKVRAFIDFFSERFADKPYWQKCIS
ncbi:LysR family transcriptional regulator [Agarilytica rhodophyticola]|uniref:LysR family transcriptional regulator n=1 Tax=Agarilytica rhodophyticola TaxID=1737490 RepID=UPI000B34873F|nr:LysR family transcriptional regulator [Agarilytica rhodophyticola]